MISGVASSDQFVAFATQAVVCYRTQLLECIALAARKEGIRTQDKLPEACRSVGMTSSPCVMCQAKPYKDRPAQRTLLLKRCAQPTSDSQHHHLLRHTTWNACGPARHFQHLVTGVERVAPVSNRSCTAVICTVCCLCSASSCIFLLSSFPIQKAFETVRIRRTRNQDTSAL